MIRLTKKDRVENVSTVLCMVVVTEELVWRE